MIKVNYKGDPTIKHSYEYKCVSCEETHIVRHKIIELEARHSCPCCGAPLKRVITCPSLDADFHDDCCSRNIGWEK